jgi:hypothetical protein
MVSGVAVMKSRDGGRLLLDESRDQAGVVADESDRPSVALADWP